MQRIIKVAEDNQSTRRIFGHPQKSRSIKCGGAIKSGVHRGGNNL